MKRHSKVLFCNSLIVAMMMTVFGCVAAPKINDPRYLPESVFTINVSSFALPDARTGAYGEKVYITSAMRDISDDDLEFIQAAKYIENSLKWIGLYHRVGQAEGADIILRVAYGIGNPQRNYDNVVVSQGYSYPVGWMWFNVPPKTKTVATTTYQRHLIIEAHGLKNKDAKQIWKLNANSEGRISDIHTVLPYMIAGSCGHMGVYSGAQVAVRYNTSTPDWRMLILYILKGPEEVFTTVHTDPSDASLEATTSGGAGAWSFVGNTPTDVRFWRSPGDPMHNLCLIRVSKPGYYTIEKKFPFESLPTEVTIVLRKVEN